MNYKTGIESISALKARTSQVIHKARETGQPIIITQHGKPAAVLQDLDSYQRQREQILMLKLILQGEQDYRRNRVVSHLEAKKHFRQKMERMKNGGETV